MPAAEPRTAACAPAGLPLGRRSPRGRARWYLAQVPEGREAAAAELARAALPAAVLDGALALRKEAWLKRGGAWRVVEKPVFPGYVVLASRDAAGLSLALPRLSVPMRLAGAAGRSYAPLDDAVAAWFSAAADARGVVRSSVAEVVGGELRVLSGPLVGQEGRIFKADRHKRRCLVRIAGGDAPYVEAMALDVPVSR